MPFAQTCTMQTRLPDLPFTNHGTAEFDPDGPHSASTSTPRRFPRTDLETLRLWASFPTDIHEAITARPDLPSTPFRIDAWTNTIRVVDEEGIRCCATVVLHIPVQEVLKKLGVNGWFSPGRGNVAVVGNPDFSWITSDAQPHPKLVVEYKTWWAANLAHIEAAFNHDAHSWNALQQVYGYMTFNNNRFGILSNWQRAVFLRRAATSDRKTLDYYVIELDAPGQPCSMLKAWVGMVLLAESDWFYASPTTSPAPPGRYFSSLIVTAWNQLRRAVRNAARYIMLPVGDNYQPRALDFRLCHFDLSSARRRANGCVVNARLIIPPALPAMPGSELQVICKVVDFLRCPNEATSLNDEARAYAALQGLQGRVIPTMHGFYDVWGILRFLALQPVGNAIPDGGQIDRRLRNKMKAALRHIHLAGYVHGDIARRNFCRTASCNIFLVDLERCRPGNPPAMEVEMNAIDLL